MVRVENTWEGRKSPDDEVMVMPQQQRRMVEWWMLKTQMMCTHVTGHRSLPHFAGQKGVIGHMHLCALLATAPQHNTNIYDHICKVL
jgi:hypothetical protein